MGQGQRRHVTVEVNPWALRQFREIAGITGAELARRVGITKAFYTNIEHGRRRAHPDLLIAIAAQLGVHAGALRARVCGEDCPCRDYLRAP